MTSSALLDKNYMSSVAHVNYMEFLSMEFEDAPVTAARELQSLVVRSSGTSSFQGIAT